MKHRKYKSIVGVWSQKEVDYLKLMGFSHPSIKWCVTEKVHGSNLAMYMNQNEFKVAKRNSFIKDGENFFQYLSLKESNGYKIRNLWDQLVYEDYDVNELIVYGELFGGSYPHPDVEKLQNVRRIQKGVYYSPNLNFYCFDILLNGEFLPMDVVCRLCEKVNIFYAKILFIGTFDECFEYPNQFQTNIPKWLGLPLLDPNEKHVITRHVPKVGLDLLDEVVFEDKEIEYYGNICEGIVIKPIDVLRYDDGSRLILKSKNDIFLETSKEKKSIRKKHHDLSEHAMDTLEKIVIYINENRLRNVLSKIGTFTRKDFRKVFDAFKRDVYEDFNVNHDNLRDMEKIDKKAIDKIVGRLCTEIWRPIFLSESER